MNRPRILIAGVGNIFLGDDAFGVAVAQRLAQAGLPEEVRVVDFGIRGLDLTYALLEDYQSVILVDAAPRGGPPGTLYVLDVGDESPMHAGDPGIETHSMDPARVRRLAAAMGGSVGRLLLVGCEPTSPGESDDLLAGLSQPVRAAVDEAVSLITVLVAQLLRGEDIAACGNDTISEKGVSPCWDSNPPIVGPGSVRRTTSGGVHPRPG
jgi:hydrogenase maturation protease